MVALKAVVGNQAVFVDQKPPSQMTIEINARAPISLAVFSPPKLQILVWSPVHGVPCFTTCWLCGRGKLLSFRRLISLSCKSEDNDGT